jgi:hypothetical protein
VEKEFQPPFSEAKKVHTMGVGGSYYRKRRIFQNSVDNGLGEISRKEELV